MSCVKHYSKNFLLPFLIADAVLEIIIYFLHRRLSPSTQDLRTDKPIACNNASFQWNIGQSCFCFRGIREIDA